MPLGCAFTWLMSLWEEIRAQTCREKIKGRLGKKPGREVLWCLDHRPPTPKPGKVNWLLNSLACVTLALILSHDAKMSATRGPHYTKVEHPARRSPVIAKSSDSRDLPSCCLKPSWQTATVQKARQPGKTSFFFFFQGVHWPWKDRADSWLQDPCLMWSNHVGSLKTCSSTCSVLQGVVS